MTGHCKIWSLNQRLVGHNLPQIRKRQSSGRIRGAKYCRARQEDRGERGGIDWDAEWRKAKQSEQSDPL